MMMRSEYYWTSLASLLGVLAFCQTLLQVLLPPEFRYASREFLSKILAIFSPYCYFDITEIDGVNTNELYNAVQLYLSSAVSLNNGSRLTLTRALNSTAITFGLSTNDSISDSFNGVTLFWEHVVTQRQSQSFSWRPLPDEKRGFTLRIRKQDKSLLLDSYLNYILDRANDIRRKNQERLLYTNARGGSLDARGHPWESVPFKHPSTFDTLAMDPLKKQQIMEDLTDFAAGMSFYHNTGRAWKRGYLLYGPPGTGKSSMIAAMANFLGYDIYDLELTEVQNNSELRKLLMKTTSKSIIVIEDIDCSINLDKRKITKGPGPAAERTHYDSVVCGDDGANNNSTITLSGLLNFTDGLWSCCGSERIFVFTTNHIEKLDPALLRSGRMDMHIFMSYCSFPALKILLNNYLGIGDLDDDVAAELEAVVEAANMTPADVSEVLIKNRRDKEKAVRELMEALKRRAARNLAKRGFMNNGSSSGVEEEDEEQEKRALEEATDMEEESTELEEEEEEVGKLK